MSGGSYDYVYRHIAAMAEVLKDASTPDRRAFASLLVDVAEALHDIEWVDSGDYSPGDENAAIERCLNKDIVLEQIIADAKVAAETLVDAIRRLETEHE